MTKSYIWQKNTKLRLFLEMLIEAHQKGEEIISKTIQRELELTPTQCGSFVTYAKNRLVQFGVKLQSRMLWENKRWIAYYSLNGDLTELQLALMSDAEKVELLKWALQEKQRRAN